MSEKVTAMIEEIKGLTVLELSELVHALEEEFGVSAAAMAAPAAGAAAPAAEEKTDFDVILTGFDAAAKMKNADSTPLLSHDIQQRAAAYLEEYGA